MKRSKPLQRRKPLARVLPKRAAGTSIAPTAPKVPKELAHLDAARVALARVLKPYALNTQRVYRLAWARWATWCEGHNLAPAPIDPMRLVVHLEELAQAQRPKSIRTALAALSAIDRVARGMRGDLDTTPIRAHAVVRGWLKSWARDTAGKGPRKAPPLGPSDLLLIVRSLDAGKGQSARAAELSAKRDRALIALGWFAAMRVSELAALDVADVRETSKGVEVTIRKSKTDQAGDGATVAIYAQAHPDLCPLQVWRSWRLEVGEDAPAFPAIAHSGALGRRLSEKGIGRVIERRAEAVGIVATSHSLRGGFATSAGEAGKQERDIQAHGRWKSVEVVRGYVSRGNQWNALNPTKDLT